MYTSLKEEEGNIQFSKLFTRPCPFHVCLRSVSAKAFVNELDAVRGQELGHLRHFLDERGVDAPRNRPQFAT